MKQRKKIVFFTVLAACLGVFAYAISLQASADRDGSAAVVAPQDDTTNDATKPGVRPRFDVVFAIDATGSMNDEIENIKKEVWTIAKTMATGQPTPDIRFGLVLYKDKGDDFIVKKTALTRDLDKVERLFKEIEVSGGGDNPEHVGQGLHTALSLDWDMGKDVTRMIYLVGDAPAHTDYQDGFSLESAIEQAQKRRISINTIGCSGIMKDGGRQQFMELASKTQGEYETLTYHQIIQGDDGRKRSVITYGGEVYEAEEVIADDEWKNEDADKLIKRKAMRPASGSTRTKAVSAPKLNNLGSTVNRDVKRRAKRKGVKFK